jgi:hypothetical protein
MKMRVKMRSTKNALQPGLFDREQTNAIECSGAELGALLASLRERGAVVLGMASVCCPAGVFRWTGATAQNRVFVQRAFKPAEFSRYAGRWRVFRVLALP